MAPNAAALHLFVHPLVHQQLMWSSPLSPPVKRLCSYYVAKDLLCLITLAVPGALEQLANVRQRSVCLAEPSLANKGFAASNIFTHQSSALIHNPRQMHVWWRHNKNRWSHKWGRRSRMFATAQMAVIYLQGCVIVLVILPFKERVKLSSFSAITLVIIFTPCYQWPLCLQET